MYTHELVVIWSDGNKETFKFFSYKGADNEGYNMMLVFGNKIERYEVREIRG